MVNTAAVTRGGLRTWGATPPRVLPPEPATWAHTAVQKAGVNIQPGWYNYDISTTAAKTLLANYVHDLGVGVVRFQVPDNTGATSPGRKAADFIRDYLHVPYGIRWHGTAGAYNPGDTDTARAAERTGLAANILEYATANPNLFLGLGGYNEPNGTRLGALNPNWPTIVATHQQWLWALRANNPGVLGAVTVSGPSLHDNPPAKTNPTRSSSQVLQEDYLSLSPCAGYMDEIEFHRYPAGQVPSWYIDLRTSWAVAGVGASKTPVVVSECGYQTHPPNAAGVTLDVQGTYAPRLYAEHWARGNTCIWFDLLCQYDPVYAADNTAGDVQSWYGLIQAPTASNADLAPSPAYTAVSRMLGLLADPGATYTPAALPMVLIRDDSVKHLLYGKRDGSYLLLLWRDVSVWSKSTKTPVSPSAVTATVQLQTAKTVSVYTPKTSATPATSTGLDHVVQLAGDLKVVAIPA